MEAIPERVQAGDTLRLNWWIDGLSLLAAPEPPELRLTFSSGLTPAIDVATDDGYDGQEIRLPLAEGGGSIEWRVAGSPAGPYFIEGALLQGEQVIASASVLLTEAGVGVSRSSGPPLAPIGWAGEVSGSLESYWSGMAGGMRWAASAADSPWQVTRGSIAFAHSGLPAEPVIEVCSRGALPADGDGAPRPVSAFPSSDPGERFAVRDWLCVRQTLSLTEADTVIRLGYFSDSQGFRSMQPALLADGARGVPSSQAWEIWVRALDGQSYAEPSTLATREAADAGGIVYLATRGNLARSRDFYTASPHWENVRGALPIPIGGRGGLIEFALDPFDPENRAWAILGDADGKIGGAVWRTENLNDASPTWVEVLSEAEIVAALGGSTAWGKRIIPSSLQHGLIFIAVSGFGGLSVGRSEDFGETWTWARALGGTSDRAVGFELSDHDVDRLWVGIGLPNSRLLVSNDRGATFQEVYSFGTWWNPYDFYVPSDDNALDQVMFAVVDGPSNAPEVYRTLDGGSSWTVVTHSGSRPGPLNRTAGSYLFDRQDSFYTHVACNGPWAFQSSEDGGSSWQTLFWTSSWLQSAWQWPLDPGHFLTARGGNNSGQSQILNALYSPDGGVTWQDMTGDWASSIGDYYGAPGTCGATSTVTIVDTQTPLPGVSDDFTRSACSGPGFSDGRECAYSSQTNTIGRQGDPINTRTGGYEETFTDISVATSAGALTFQRSYSSEAIQEFTELLGFGWTHNHDTRLIFPEDPGGQSGLVLFHAHTVNVYHFVEEPGGGYTPAPGIHAALLRNDGPPVTYTLRDSTQATYTFDDAGRLLAWSDPQGHAWAYSYDGSSRLARVTDDTAARYLDFEYDAQGRLIQVSDHSGRDVGFGYNAAGDLSTVTDVLGQTWTYVYDAAHRLRQVLDPAVQQVSRTEYDAQGRADRQYDASDTLVLQLTYNPDGTTTIVDALGNVSTHAYDQRGTLTGETDSLGNPASTTYAASFRPETLTDENGRTIRLSWSADGATLTGLEDGEGHQVGLVYDDLNNMRQITDARGQSTIYTYNETDPDPARRTLLLSVEDALGNTTTYTYTTSAHSPQPTGLLRTITDPLGNTTLFTYNETGRRISTTDSLGHATLYAYDALGRLQRTTDPLGHVHWTCYDAADRVVRTVANATGDGGTPQTDPCNAAQYIPGTAPDQDRVTTTVYDVHGRAIATIDSAGVITRTYFDASNRPVVIVQNLAGQPIENPTPPAYNPAFPDRNVRSETVYDDAGNPIATIDNRGIITRTYYDALGRPEFVVLNLVGQGIGAGTPPAYNPAYPDRNVRTQYVYDPAGNLIASLDTLGRITRTYYDGNNRPVAVVQNLTGQAIDHPSPPARNPAYPDRNVRTDTVYDPNGNAIATIDPDGVITRTYFDVLNRPEVVVRNLQGQDISVSTPPAYNPAHPDRNVRTQYVYDDAGRQIAAIDPNGVITRTYFDDAGRTEYVVQNLYGQAISVSTPPAYSPTYPDRNVRTQHVYDDAGRQIATIDPNGVITRTYYDGLGRVHFVVRNLTGQGIGVGTPPAFNPAYPDRNVRTETVYDAEGDAIAAIDNAGVITRMYYDSLHRPVTVVQNLTGQGVEVTTPPAFNPAFPDQNVRTDTVYGDGGEVARTVDTLGRALVSCYDGQGRVIKTVQNPSVASPCGAYTPSSQTDLDIITLTTYDGVGNRTSLTDPNGFETIYQYDSIYRLLSEANPLGHTTSSGYSLGGARVSVTDAEGVVTRFEFDALTRLTAVVQNHRPGLPADHETNVRTEYTYDAAGYRLAIIDGNGNTTAFTYDALGRLKTESDALAHTWTYGYDAAGNRTSLLDAEGFTTTFAYDGLHRLVAIDYPAPDADVTYTYDAAGDRVGMADGVGTTQWVYDDLHRPTSVTDPFAGVAAYTYDGLGARLSLTYPDARVASYLYDAAGRLQQVTDWDSGTTSYSYDRGGRPVTSALPSGVLTTSTFDDAGRLLTLTHTQGSTTLASYAYTYDDTGNRTTAQEAIYTPPSVALPDVIFANGFESGGLTAWSSSSTGSGTLTVSTGAALAGAYGMQALINSTTARYVQDAIPYAEPRYRARFYFDPNSSTMANNDAYYLFYGYSGSSTVVLRLELGYTTTGGYRLRVSARDNASTWSYSGWVNIADAPHAIELDWQSAAAGRVDWWIDGASQAAVTGFNNSTRRIDQVRLGTVAGLDAGTSGTVYFDAFDSRRASYMGALTDLPDAIFADDFESGGVGYWSASTGVSVTTAASLAPAGTQGLAVPLASATTAKFVTDNAPGVETRYRARFYFDPNSVTMANNSDHVIFYADSGTTAVLQMDLGFTTAGGYRLRTRLRDNASAWNNSTWVNITDAPHIIEVDWQSGNPGSLAWWIDEAPQPAPTPINNSARRIDRIRLGAVAGVDSTTNGTLYFDAFESRRATYIGPMPGGLVSTTINYAYDPLYRLTAADYSDGGYFHYTYDAVGNRLTEVTASGTTAYTYDRANRLLTVGGVTYTWSDNGNLLGDGTYTYAYDHADRLISATWGTRTHTFAYNGLGDRLRQTVDGTPTPYTIDMAAALTQVLSAGGTAYLYGNGRIGEEQPGSWQYHLGDALGSLRQLGNASADITLARTYEPFGDPLITTGAGSSIYGFTGEQRDGTGLVYLRARYYGPYLNQWIQPDSIVPDPYIPADWNRYAYVRNNPVNYTDPSGLFPLWLTPSGYAEGRALTLEVGGGFAIIEGREIVYDFATMERAIFTYREVEPDLDICTSAVGVTASPYYSVVFGFDPGDSLNEDWGGYMISGQFGIDIPIWRLCAGPVCPSPGAGLAGFVSADSPDRPNLDVGGYEVYMSAGVGVSVPLVWASKFAVYTTMDESSWQPYGSDIGRMQAHILSGNASPITIVGARWDAARWAQAWHEWRVGQ